MLLVPPNRDFMRISFCQISPAWIVTRPLHEPSSPCSNFGNTATCSRMTGCSYPDYGEGNSPLSLFLKDVGRAKDGACAARAWLASLKGSMPSHAHAYSRILFCCAWWLSARVSPHFWHRKTRSHPLRTPTFDRRSDWSNGLDGLSAISIRSVRRVAQT